MPADSSVLTAIQAIRNAIAASGRKDLPRFELSFAISHLFRQSEKIVGDVETLRVVLAAAAEVEAFRGKGSKSAASLFSRGVAWLVYQTKDRLPRSSITPDLFPQEEELREISKDTNVLECLEALAAHAFARIQGPPVRSRHAGELRAMAWGALGDIADTLRRPEFLAHALKVAADKRASTEERIAVVEFLSEYWGGDVPDQATASLLQELKDSPPDRDFLVAVMQARIELGLDEELGALSAVEDWDEARGED
jgi:hypothetical protein